jgi:hypothetical protein
MKGAENQFAQFVEGLIDAGVQIGGGQYPYPTREQCAIYVQPKGNIEVRDPYLPQWAYVIVACQCDAPVAWNGALLMAPGVLLCPALPTGSVKFAHP